MLLAMEIFLHGYLVAVLSSSSSSSSMVWWWIRQPMHLDSGPLVAYPVRESMHQESSLAKIASMLQTICHYATIAVMWILRNLFGQSRTGVQTTARSSVH